MLRLAAALSLLLGITALMGFLGTIGEGPGVPLAARHLREMKDRAVAPPAVAPWTITDLESLPHRVPVARYAPLERRGVRIEGYVQRLLRASDGDTHLELVESARVPGGPDTTYVTAEITPQWQRHAPRWTYGALVPLFRPNHGGVTPWDAGPRRVRLTGWLMYDYQYDAPPSSWSLRYGAARATGWEMHPVTAIERWDDSTAAWVDVPR